ncbi:hypothetical protein HGA88_06910 [Candidatus Roizmanbacteria bacterium]|nr:hypothetical protein [Candidatus Roizmanbacteria bacterium]
MVSPYEQSCLFESPLTPGQIDFIRNYINQRGSLNTTEEIIAFEDIYFTAFNLYPPENWRSLLEMSRAIPQKEDVRKDLYFEKETLTWKNVVDIGQQVEYLLGGHFHVALQYSEGSSHIVFSSDERIESLPLITEETSSAMRSNPRGSLTIPQCDDLEEQGGDMTSARLDHQSTLHAVLAREPGSSFEGYVTVVSRTSEEENYKVLVMIPAKGGDSLHHEGGCLFQQFGVAPANENSILLKGMWSKSPDGPLQFQLEPDLNPTLINFPEYVEKRTQKAISDSYSFIPQLCNLIVQGEIASFAHHCKDI